MNRALRRRHQIHTKETTYSLTNTKIKSMVVEHADRVISETKRQAINITYQYMLASMIIVLKDKFGFGPQRLNKMISEVNKQFDCMHSGHVTGAELVDWCREYGIEIREVMPKN